MLSDSISRLLCTICLIYWLLLSVAKQQGRKPNPPLLLHLAVSFLLTNLVISSLFLFVNFEKEQHKLPLRLHWKLKRNTRLKLPEWKSTNFLTWSSNHWEIRVIVPWWLTAEVGGQSLRPWHRHRAGSRGRVIRVGISPVVIKRNLQNNSLMEQIESSPHLHKIKSAEQRVPREIVLKVESSG